MSLKDKLKTAAGITLAGLGLTALVEIAGCETGSKLYVAHLDHPVQITLQPKPYDGPRFFACKEVVDRNNNDNLDFPEDFPGISSMFHAEEDVCLVSIWENKKGGTVKAKLIKPDKGEIQLGGDDYIYGNFLTLQKGLVFHSPGMYKAEYFLNGSYAGGHEVQITEPFISQ